MRVAPTSDNSQLQLRFAQEYPQNLLRDVVRIAPAHGYKDSACTWSTFPFVSSPEGELAPQHDITGPQKQAKMRRPILVEFFTGMNVLIQDDVCRVWRSIAI